MWGIVASVGLGAFSYFSGFFSGKESVIENLQIKEESGFFEINKVSLIVWSILILLVTWLFFKVSGEVKRLLRR
jgi:hypothetical protein